MTPPQNPIVFISKLIFYRKSLLGKNKMLTFAAVKKKERSLNNKKQKDGTAVKTLSQWLLSSTE